MRVGRAIAVCLIGVLALTILPTISSQDQPVQARGILFDWAYIGPATDVQGACEWYVANSIAPNLSGALYVEPNSAQGSVQPGEYARYVCAYTTTGKFDKLMEFLDNVSTIINPRAAGGPSTSFSVTIPVTLSADVVCRYQYGYRLGNPSWYSESLVYHTDNFRSYQEAGCVSTSDRLPRYAGQIVRQASSGTSWLVDSNGQRHWIPQGGDFECLVQRGVRWFDVSNAVLDQLPDVRGNHATCTPLTVEYFDILGVDRSEVLQSVAIFSAPGVTVPLRDFPTYLELEPLAIETHSVASAGGLTGSPESNGTPVDLHRTPTVGNRLVPPVRLQPGDSYGTVCQVWGDPVSGNRIWTLVRVGRAYGFIPDARSETPNPNQIEPALGECSSTDAVAYNRLENETFDEGLDYWDVSGAGSAVSLPASNAVRLQSGDGRMALRQSFPTSIPDGHWLRVSTMAKPIGSHPVEIAVEVKLDGPAGTVRDTTVLRLDPTALGSQSAQGAVAVIADGPVTNIQVGVEVITPNSAVQLHRILLVGDTFEKAVQLYNGEYDIREHKEPRGFLGASSPEPGVVAITGFAGDPSAPGVPVALRAFVGGTPGDGGRRVDIGTASTDRINDVTNHVDLEFNVPGDGLIPICVYAVNILQGSDTLLTRQDGAPGCDNVVLHPAPRPIDSASMPCTVMADGPWRLLDNRDATGRYELGASGDAGSVWCEFEPEESVLYRVEIGEMTSGHDVLIFREDPSSDLVQDGVRLDLIGAFDDGDGYIDADAGERYLVRMDTVGGRGFIPLRIVDTSGPDSRERPCEIPVEGDPFYQYVRGYTLEAGDDFGGLGSWATASVWCRFVADSTGIVEVAGSGIGGRTVIASPNAVSSAGGHVVAVTHSDGDGNRTIPKIRFPVEEGETVEFVVGFDGDTTSAVYVDYEIDPSINPDFREFACDLPQPATPVVVEPSWFKTLPSDDFGPMAGRAGGSAWCRFVPDRSGTAVVEVAGRYYQRPVLVSPTVAEAEGGFVPGRSIDGGLADVDQPRDDAPRTARLRFPVTEGQAVELLIGDYYSGGEYDESRSFEIEWSVVGAEVISSLVETENLQQATRISLI